VVRHISCFVVFAAVQVLGPPSQVTLPVDLERAEAETMLVKCWAPEAVGCGALSSLGMTITVFPLVAARGTRAAHSR